MVESFFGGLLVLALLLGGGVYLLQGSAMYPGTARSHDPVRITVRGIEPVWLSLPFGRVETWLMPGRGEGRRAPLVIFAHGNGELIDDWPLHLGMIRRQGFALMLVEFPGYGRSEGRPSQETINQTLLAAYDTAVARPDIDPERVVLFGRSLGGAAVATLLDQRPVAALILQSTFTSARDMAWELFSVPGFLVRDAWPTREALERYDGPTLVIHGRDDEIIPYPHGEALARAARNGELVTYDCGHNDCPPSWPEFWQDIERFLSAQGLVDTPVDQPSSSS